MGDVKEICSGKYLQLVEKDGWEYVTKPAKCAVVVIPVLDNGNLILIDEYRHPLQKRVISFPAGLIGDEHQEDIFHGARRELLEETGYLSKNIKLLLPNSPSSSATTDELFNLMLATSLVKIGDGGGDDSEDINVLQINRWEIPDRIVDWRGDGKLIDHKLFTGLFFIDCCGLCC